MRNQLMTLLGILLAPYGWAQSIPAAATDRDEGSQLAEIVITAQRRSESLQHAAVAVSAVTGQDLRESGVSRPADLTAVLPSIQVASSAGPYALIYIRGVGNFNANALSDPAVAFNFDGAYIGRPSSTTGFFYDIDRIELLKGPQGTLYGRNATGGALNVLPSRPVLGETSGSASIDFGNHSAVRTDAEVNLPLGDFTAVRVAGSHVSHSPYMDDGSDDQNENGGRLSILTKPIENLSVSVVGDYFGQNGRGIGSTPSALGVGGRYGNSSPQGMAYYQSQYIPLGGNFFGGIPQATYQHNQYWGVTGNIDYTLAGLGTLTFVPAYREGHLNFNSTGPGFGDAVKEDDAQHSFELRFASDESRPFRYLLGVFHYNETNDIPDTYIRAQYQFSPQVQTTDTKSIAGFGRLTYAITNAIRVTAGARYTKDDKNFDGTLLSYTQVCLGAVTPPFTGTCPGNAPVPYNQTIAPTLIFPPGSTNAIPVFDPATGVLLTGNKITAAQSASFSKPTWHGSVDWDVTDHNLLYASYETGFKAGGFFFSNDGGVYKPETIEAWTIGSKNTFLENRLQVNVEGFLWRYKDQQISHLSQDSTGTTIFGTYNVGHAQYKGFETDVKYLPISNTLLSADVQYLSAVYDSFLFVSPQAPFSGCPSGAVATGFSVNCSGKTPPFAPRWTINVAAQQSVPLSNGAKMVGDIRAHFQTSSLTGLDFLPSEYQGQYAKVDVALSYVAPSSKYTATLYCNNVADRTVISNTYPPVFAAFTVATLQPPRTYGGRIDYHF